MEEPSLGRCVDLFVVLKLNLTLQQEAWMAIALILQRFQVELAEPDYEMKIRQTLTIKPVGYHLKIRLRPGKSLYTGIISPPQSLQEDVAKAPKQSGLQSEKQGLPQIGLAILYGSNQGTCKTFAESIQTAAPSHGFHVSTIGSLDCATENMPTDVPIVTIAPSYEGQPPDNGKKAVAWLQANREIHDKLKGVKYCVMVRIFGQKSS